MTFRVQQEKLHYEKTNPLLWLYDKLFPLPAESSGIPAEKRKTKRKRTEKSLLEVSIILYFFISAVPCGKEVRSYPFYPDFPVRDAPYRGKAATLCRHPFSSDFSPGLCLLQDRSDP